MRYLALIYGDENAEFTEEQGAAEMQAYLAFGEEGGKATITDGPFAETKEQLGGYYELQCDNLDQAIEWAAKIPGAKNGRVEVRPIMEFDQA